MYFKKEMTRLILLFRKYIKSVQHFLLLCITAHKFKIKKCNSTTVQVRVGNISYRLYFSLNPWINIHCNQVNGLIVCQHMIDSIDSRIIVQSPDFFRFSYILIYVRFKVSILLRYLSYWEGNKEQRYYLACVQE